MKLLTKLVAGGGVAAFFFFSWVIMKLWNSLVVRLFDLPALRYLEVCGLWFLVILVFAWAGIAMNARVFIGRRREERREEVGRRIDEGIKRGFARWVDADEHMEWDEIGERMEKKFKAKFKEWLKED